MKRSDLLALAAGLAALALAPTAAHAYCRTASCAAKTAAWQVCEPATSDDCGTALFWPKQCIGFTLQKDASSQVSLQDAETTFTAAFATWMNAGCADGHPSISIEYMGPVDCDTQEYNKKKANANVIMFRDASWPYEGGSNTLALTTVTYSLESGEIYDADMELNSADIGGFTIGDDAPKFDLLSIATHETGHFLGLAHSAESDATMFANYGVGTTALRDLSADDISGICAAYPPSMPHSADCNTEPRHGFSSLCAAAQPEPSGNGGSGGGGCAAAPASGDGGRLAWAGFFALGLLTSLRRKRPRRKP
jgi:MYXO-CTERM domain-containing protein